MSENIPPSVQLRPSTPPSPSPAGPIQRHGSKHLTRDQRLQVKTLRDAGHPLQDITRLLNISFHQAQYVARSEQPVTPRKRKGRPSYLTEDQVEELEIFVCSSQTGRLMSYLQLSLAFSHWNVSEHTIRHALEKRGFRRYAARLKPPLTETNRRKRLAWAYEHKDWTREQWSLILWSDESWITGGHHRRIYVTRRPGEELDPTCVIEKHRKRNGWMFWGCFNGETKGPGIFWEKEWGTIRAESYCERIVPIVEGWINTIERQTGRRLIFMQDGAPAHAAQLTLDELHARRIVFIYWPPYSPDLNPIEAVWNWMKNYIEAKWGPNTKLSYARLRDAVKEAWDAVPVEFLRQLIDDMPKRCQAVIDAEGRFTKF
jgi:transposase